LKLFTICHGGQHRAFRHADRQMGEMDSTEVTLVPKDKFSHSRRRIAFFLSADSFEGFYGGIFGLDRETFLASYRNDFVWEYAEGLRTRGHSVVLYILSYGLPELRTVSDGLQVRFLGLPKWLRLVDPFTYRLRKLAGFRTLRDRVAFVGYGKALMQALESDQADVLYHQEIWTPRFDLIARTSTVPVVGAEHGAVYATWMEADKRDSLHRAAWITCQSVETLRLAASFGGRSHLLYNAVDTEFFAPDTETPRTSGRILAVGRLVEEQKRFADLLRAMILLPEFTLLLVGSGPDERRLQGLAAELGLKDRVQFLGFIADRSELRRLYRECSVFVLSSAWEAVALVVLEAMSCGMPVVSTRIPSLQELLRDGVDGLLVPIGAPEEISKAVRVAVERSALLGAEARRTVIEKYSAQALYARLSVLLESAGTAKE
jgi:glycosyltransferase involved in cell wall biosynthesis